MTDGNPIYHRTANPVRPTGTAATLEQVRVSADAMGLVIRYLCDRGFPEPVIVASGNGTHSYNACDLANTPETAALLRALYEGLAHEFSQAGLVTFDVTVRSAAQIMRWPGSFNIKAQRQSEILAMPETFAPVSLETNRAVVNELHAKHRNKPPKVLIGREGGWTAERMEAFLNFHNIDHCIRKAIPQGLLWVLRPCPLNADHVLTSSERVLRHPSIRQLHAIEERNASLIKTAHAAYSRANQQSS